MLPVVTFTLMVRTWLVRGLTAGGLKDYMPAPLATG